jgi:hypothetical protein
MRSELIFKAVARESNRYKLVRLAAKATRILHWPNTRIQDTMNSALQHVARYNSIATAPPSLQSAVFVEDLAGNNFNNSFTL